MTEEKKKGRLARLSERILAETDNTPEESARLKAEREALYGTGSQWAQLQDDLSIAQEISQCTPDGSMGHGHSVSVPGNDDYEYLRKLHKLEKPGDASTVFKRFIDGAWVVVEDQAK
jgi:hypothetical protein